MTTHANTSIRIVDTLTIDGRPVHGAGERLSIPNPATGEVLGEVSSASIDQTEEAILAARRAFDDGRWTSLTPQQRSQAIYRLADRIEARYDELVDVIVAEVGTPRKTAGPMQVDLPLACLRWFAEAALTDRTRVLGPAKPFDSMSMVNQVPVGVVGAISAYNYPITLASWKIGAALAAGCTTVLVPSPYTPFSTLLLGELILEADLPPGVVNVIAGGVDVSKLVTTHPEIDKVAFTGSDRVGRQVMSQAAQSLKGVVLELGGKSPAIILPGTDLSTIVEPLALRYCRNAGQGCASPTRILVHSSQRDEFVARARQVIGAMPTGDPLDLSTEVGPLIREQHRDRVADMVDEAVAAGGSILARGSVPEGLGGWFYPATLLGDLAQDARAVQEEIFGPVAVLSTYESVDEAMAMANGVDFGLQAYVYGADVQQCVSVAGRLRAGTVTVNGGGARVDAPFGGFKRSGVGRELGEWGVDEYLEPQHVQVSFATPAPAKA
jgi:aldehyde dehydrogenase (NAD+)/betaine-aldehyde dehydrogenase